MSNPDIALSGQWANTFVLKHSPNPSWDSGSTYAYYGLWYVPPTSSWNDGTTEGESSHIKVNTTTNEWSDHGGNHPGSNVSRSGETITLRSNGGAIRATFTRPPLSTYSSGSGGGTSTEGVQVPGGSLTFSNGSVSYTINSDSPTTSSTQYYGIQENGNFIGATANGISHNNGTSTTGSVSGTVGTVYRLMHTNTGGGTTVLTELASLTATLATAKKVFCNFW
jgi:hypothetical protein